MPKNFISNYRIPQSDMTIFFVTFPVSLVPYFSIFLTHSIPSTTEPKTTFIPSSHGVSPRVMKNCDPLVFGVGWLFAMDKVPTNNVVWKLLFRFDFLVDF